MKNFTFSLGIKSGLQDLAAMASRHSYLSKGAFDRTMREKSEVMEYLMEEERASFVKAAREDYFKSLEAIWV